MPVEYSTRVSLVVDTDHTVEAPLDTGTLGGPFTADTTLLTADTTAITADAT